MQRIALLSGFLIGLGSAMNTVMAQPPMTGEQVVQALRTRYADTRYNCGGPPQPSYVCNGLLIRGTGYSPDYHAWNNNPRSHEKGAVSFSYLRSDSVFSKIDVGYKDGYIFQAYQGVDDKLQPEVLCGFPVDGYTWVREGTGCDVYPGNAQSGPCQEQGVYSAEDWARHYGPAGNGQRACGFDMRLSLGNGAWRAFDENIKARRLLPLIDRPGNNELRLKVWEDQDGSSLPLEAFFYFVTDSSTPRENARLNQKDLKDTANVTVPVIAIHMPADPEGDVVFEYKSEDQAIPLPGTPVKREPPDSPGCQCPPTSSDAPASPPAVHVPAALDRG